MRFVRHVVLAAIAVVLITAALANRAEVTLRFLPEGLAELVSYPAASNAITLPLFVVIFMSLVAGILLGFVWEWLREHKYRVEARHQRREKERLAHEVAAIGQEKSKDDYADVLALLEDDNLAR